MKRLQTRSGFEKTKQEKQELGQTDKKRRAKDTEDKRQGQKQKKKKKRREDSGKHSHLG